MHSVRSVTISGCLLVGNKSVSFDHEQYFKMILLNQKRRFLLAGSPNSMASKDQDIQGVYGYIPQLCCSPKTRNGGNPNMHQLTIRTKQIISLAATKRPECWQVL